jgi:hypothetical protein
VKDRNMKCLLKSLLVATPLLGIGCVPNDSPINILNPFPYQNAASNGACQAMTVGIPFGTLDISGNTSYILQWTVESTLDPSAAGSRNDFVATEVDYSYTTVPALNPALANETLPYSWRIPAGASGTSSFIGMQMIGPAATTQLINTVRPGNQVQVSVTFYLRGALASGQKLNTNKVSYSIDVYNSGFAGCAVGVRRIPSGPCQTPGGQDGTVVGCCSGTPLPAGC